MSMTPSKPDFSAASAILREGIAARAFPGASFSVVANGGIIASEGIGRLTYEAESPSVSGATIYDLASVTKVVATTTMAMLLYERGQLDLDLPLAAVLPEFAGLDRRRSQVTLKMLLAHSSGLPAYERLYEKAKSPEAMISAAAHVGMVAEPNSRVEYSDVGFILLGEALRRIADEDLDAFCAREIFGPLSLAATAFNPPQEWRAHVPPTEDDRNFRHRVIQGEVHDENASVMAGVAGHAGLFSTVGDLGCFGQCMLKGGEPILRRETIELFTKAVGLAPQHALGWDLPTPPSQAGSLLSSRSFGHLGFTGTSLWVDPENRVAITLLTNRTWPDTGNQAIRTLRPRIHDAIVGALEREPLPPRELARSV